MKKKIVGFLLLMLFLAISFLLISPVARHLQSDKRSSQLQKIVTYESNAERTDYKDFFGKTTIAADLGYATCIITRNEKSQVEKYYDDKGQPIRRYMGYYAILREFDNQGNNTRITYLDENDNPVMMNGYAIEERKYNENKQIMTVKYYDTDNKPVFTPFYGYGKENEYDDNGHNTKITYIDLFGKPVMTGLGYASVVRVFYIDGVSKGKIEREYYYDNNDEPICLSLGQYGVYKEYDDNGQEALLTYLDAEGNPIATNKGYTTIIRTYHADNTIATEQYYDMDGNAYSLSEGQYGIKKKDGKTTYLNKNGREQFNIRTLLYNHSWLTIVIALVTINISSLLDKKANAILLALYVIVIAYFTLLFRDAEGIGKTDILWYYRKIFSDSEARADILKNIWLFIPLGAILYQLWPKKSIILVAIILSIVIESVQYLSGTGFCELDDVISNSLGGFIGFYTGKLTTGLFERINRRKQIHSV